MPWFVCLLHILIKTVNTECHGVMMMGALSCQNGGAMKGSSSPDLPHLNILMVQILYTRVHFSGNVIKTVSVWLKSEKIVENECVFFCQNSP